MLNFDQSKETKRSISIYGQLVLVDDITYFISFSRYTLQLIYPLAFSCKIFAEALAS
jgi:hypothetical protein